MSESSTAAQALSGPFFSDQPFSHRDAVMGTGARCPPPFCPSEAPAGEDRRGWQGRRRRVCGRGDASTVWVGCAPSGTHGHTDTCRACPSPKESNSCLNSPHCPPLVQLQQRWEERGILRDQEGVMGTEGGEGESSGEQRRGEGEDSQLSGC